MKAESRYKPGDKIGGRYIVHDVKMGGMGIVFICFDKSNKMPRALKTFQDRFFANSGIVDCFTEEARIWIELGRCLNTVSAKEIEIIDNKPYAIIELVSSHNGLNPSLKDWLEFYGSFGLASSLNFAIQFCLGMVHATGTLPGLVHRDIKPGNILIDGWKNLLKITDFGLAKVTDNNIATQQNLDLDTDSGHSRIMLNEKGAWVGTPPYIAPEQWLGHSIDTRADIYSFGCVLYEMLTGQRVYKANSIEGYRISHLEKKPHDISALNPKIPVRVAKIVHRCLDKDASSRYQTFLELLSDVVDVYEAIEEVPRLEFSLGAISAFHSCKKMDFLGGDIYLRLVPSTADEIISSAKSLELLGYPTHATTLLKDLGNIEQRVPSQGLSKKDANAIFRAIKKDPRGRVTWHYTTSPYARSGPPPKDVIAEIKTSEGWPCIEAAYSDNLKQDVSVAVKFMSRIKMLDKSNPLGAKPLLIKM